MKLLFDLFPVILFFVAFKLGDIYAATGVAIAATVAQIAWLKLRRKTVEPMQWASLVLIVVFGGMTLAFHDETFIKWKPTLLYALFAGALLLAPRFTGRNPLRSIMGAQIALPDEAWSRLTLAWTAFFAAMAVLNVVVAYSFSLDAWVNFKLFGTLGLTLVFVVLQAVWIGRHVQDPS
ncbi:MAG TPA: septation protein A [Burkholderiaceae bacterium]|nr:septation protein A [Burkholderiaceae bacterium]